MNYPDYGWITNYPCSGYQDLFSHFCTSVRHMHVPKNRDGDEASLEQQHHYTLSVLLALALA